MAADGSGFHLASGFEHGWFPRSRREPRTNEYPPYQTFSQYVTMSDNVRLAVDVYLPHNYERKPGSALPTVLHFTRYNRKWRMRWPMTLLFGQEVNIRTLNVVSRFVKEPCWDFGDDLAPRACDPVYAVVSVDVRGTGASFGVRSYDMTQREKQDYQEVLHWVSQQHFCNGKIGSGGISYDGMAATQLAAGDTRNLVKAIYLLCSPNDIYEDLCFPGGVPCSGFMDSYRHFTFNGERNVIWLYLKSLFPFLLLLAARFMVAGVAPVKNDETDGEKELQVAIQQHADNWDMKETLRRVLYKDDEIVAADGARLTALDAGTTAADLLRIRDKGIAVCSVGGYFDSGSARTVTRAASVLSGAPAGTPVVCSSRNKVTLGPWNHGVRCIGSPYSTYLSPKFDAYSDMKRFFDAHLCGIDKNHSKFQQDSSDGHNSGGGDYEAAVSNNSNSNSRSSSNSNSSSTSSGRPKLIMPEHVSGRYARENRFSAVLSEPAVHYYVMGSERWESADCWPISSVEWTPFTLEKGGKLYPVLANSTSMSPSSSSGRLTAAEEDGTSTETTEVHQLDFTARSGISSRWNLVQHILLQPLGFTHQPQKWITFTSPPLSEDITFVGAPRLRLNLRPIGGRDAVLIAYLLDVDEVGESTQSHYLTEGVLRAANRHTPSVSCQPSQSLLSLPLTAPFDRTFTRAAAAPLPADQFTVMDIHLEPIAATIFKGHRVQIALCGCDTDNFDLSLLQGELATAWELKYSAGVSGCCLALPKKI